MAGSTYFGILISKETMLFNTGGPTYFCCTKLKESVTLLILLCLGKRIGLKEQEKLDNYYSELKWEVKKILNLSQIMAVPVVIGALRVTCKEWLKTWDVKSSIELLQKAALFGTIKIVRQIILETWGCWVELAP